MVETMAARFRQRTRFRRIDSFEAWQAYGVRSEGRRRRIARTEAALPVPGPVELDGWCHVCGGRSQFTCSSTNLREDLVCAGCGLWNRVRASMRLFEQECRPLRHAAVYMTEQVTPLYRVVAERHPGVCGSEYLGDQLPAGETVDGVRNESLTELSFDTGSFDHLLSFEVFEHIPDYRRAFAECARVLRPGGSMVFSVPFLTDSPTTLVRARVGTDGEIEHLLEPEYHGNPLSADGSLCFQHFGWDILDDLRRAGFARAWACAYWSRRHLYLGGEQIQFLAVR